MSEVYERTGMNKRRVWSTPKTMLAVDTDALSVTVPGTSGHRVNVAVEDIRLELPEESFATSVQMALDYI